MHLIGESAYRGDAEPAQTPKVEPKEEPLEMKNPARITAMALAITAVLMGAPIVASAQAYLQGRSGWAEFELNNQSAANTTFSVVNQGLSVAVPSGTYKSLRSLPFYFPNTDSTGFYRISVANTATGAVVCEGVVQMKYTQSSQTVQCLFPSMGRCRITGGSSNGDCYFRLSMM